MKVLFRLQVTLQLKLNYHLDVIYLNGLYVEPLFYNGVKGVRIYHDSEYFKERTYYHR